MDSIYQYNRRNNGIVAGVEEYLNHQYKSLYNKV